MNKPTLEGKEGEEVPMGSSKTSMLAPGGRAMDRKSSTHHQLSTHSYHRIDKMKSIYKNSNAK